MRCAWDMLIRLLPLWLRSEVDKYKHKIILEIRLRIHTLPELKTVSGSFWLERAVVKEDLLFCLNAASEYSPWTAATLENGYITAQGGHRIGLCGNATVIQGQMKGISDPTSLCLRIARDFPGIADGLWRIPGSVLIVGMPGSGKTTLLRDLIRQRSNHLEEAICVVDEKREVFPQHNGASCFPAGKCTDIITGCNKAQGIMACLRNMGPRTIAVDEITAPQDCDALVQAGWCGVNLIATAHAANSRDLHMRPIYRPILNSGIFDTLVTLQKDKSWRLERMKEC